jgi:hypothetical protein
MEAVPPDPRDRPSSGIGIATVRQLIHAGVVLSICSFVFILRLSGDLGDTDVSTIYALVLGHVGTAASQGLRNRSSDG